ncbi:hypothetical protein Tco_0989938 [Tanacetum coccineum]|uniref:Uncharacterized protein n=1 Tax=Tanacetum coccineum TaxID=301880 RepID=A0ABQ5EVK8_9ASTR
MYEKLKRSDEDFIAIGSVADEKLIKRMNKKDSSKGEEIKEESKEEVKKEENEEGTRKRKLGTRKKMKSRKRRYIQNTSEDDSDKENDELRLYLTIAQDEEKEVDYEILDRKFPIKEWKTECLGTKPQPDQAEPIEDINLNVVTRSNGQKRYFSTLTTVLSIFDREDLNAVYQLVMDKYQDEMPEGFERVLWGDLMVLFKPDEQDEFWNSQHKWNVISWKLHSSSGVHTLMTEEGLVIHMLIEKKYPLKKEIVVQMLKLKLESEEESTMALELIRFIKKGNQLTLLLGKELASPKPTNNNLRTSSNTQNKNVDTSPRYKNDNQTAQFRNYSTVTVAGARETVGSQECRKLKRAKDYTYHKEKMSMCKQVENCVPLQAEQVDWLEDTDEEVDEQELKAHYMYMEKIQEVHTTDSTPSFDVEPLEKADQNAKECDDERVVLANLIANLKLDTDKNKKIQKQLKKANTSLAHELQKCKSALEK